MPAHLIEIEDLPFVPSWFRDLGTDWVRFTSERMGLYRSAATRMAGFLKDLDGPHVVDLCSGSGGGWLSLLPQLDDLGVGNVRITLSDKYPNLRAANYLARESGSRLQYSPEASDDVRGPADSADAYTMMLAFHHFPENVAVQVLTRLTMKGRPIAIFDIWGPGVLQRVPRAIGYLLFPVALILNIFVPLLVLIGTPRVRPFRWSRLIFTYLLPFIPLYIWWDATVSILRAYDQDGLRRIVRQADPAKSFEWQVGLTSGPGPKALSYVIGIPR